MAIKWGNTYVTAVKWGNTVCTQVKWGLTVVFPTGGWDGSGASVPLNGNFYFRDLMNGTWTYPVTFASKTSGTTSKNIPYSSSESRSSWLLLKAYDKFDYSNYTKITFSATFSGTNASIPTSIELGYYTIAGTSSASYNTTGSGYYISTSGSTITYTLNDTFKNGYFCIGMNIKQPAKTGGGTSTVTWNITKLEFS